MKTTPETATGLRVDITILCETEEEILSHLSAMRAELKKQLKEKPEITHCIQIEDSNCYGEHLMVINLDR
jgi:hypothetical protein